MDYTERSMYKNEMANWLGAEGFIPNYFMTLTFRDNRLTTISHQRAERAFKKLIIKLNMELFGRRSKKALKMVTFIEGDDYKKRHFHVLLNVPKEFLGKKLEDFMHKIKSIWIRSDSLAGNPFTHDATGENWFKEIKDSNDIEKIVGYSLKEQCLNNEPFEVELTNLDGRRVKSR